MHECEFCHKQFKFEHHYENHICDRMRRDYAIKTQTGKKAILFFKEWWTALGRTYPGDYTFMISKYFKQMLKFTKYAERVKLPQPLLFINWVATKKKFPPSLWSNDKVFVEWMIYIDNNRTITESVHDSLKWIIRHCEDVDVPISEFLDNISDTELLLSVQYRYVCKWILLLTPGFHDRMDKMQGEQKILLTAQINIDRTTEDILRNKQEIREVKQLLKDIGYT